ncbi:coiled-coil domain-containing protein 34-like isoform X2 [Puntigrus tetrazona]|uniref:coiled-coil domain-containing protein 34-like isoform X2 n=1 Tax=Puntigrus tetrazona TaxID=1606681 RepID=UPI001C89A828|nr:coiled-coil domain-containing protein 34-like isoform X2 [Puntigrus tetrazona]
MMSTFPSSSSKSLTSTPLKSRAGGLRRSRSLESTGDSTSSLLSPIYHDSFELSEEEPESDQPRAVRSITATSSEDVAGSSPYRDGVDAKGLEERLSSVQLKLSAWEQWIVEKAKEERVRKQQKATEELTLKEKQKEVEKEQQKKKVVNDGKIQEWLQIKREREKKEKMSKEFQKSKEQLQEENKRAEIEKKAQEKYKEWLRKKKQEETERKLREKEEAARREAEERERKEKAEESFKEWLEGVKTKGKLSRRSSASSAGRGIREQTALPRDAVVQVGRRLDDSPPDAEMQSAGQEDEDRCDFLFKIILIGDSNVGKTCVIHSFRSGLFSDGHHNTIGVDFTVRTIDIDGKKVKMQVWDTAGQERFRTITQSYYRSAHGAMIAYDLTRRTTFESLRHWIQGVEQYGAASVVFVLIGQSCEELLHQPAERSRRQI